MMFSPEGFKLDWLSPNAYKRCLFTAILLETIMLRTKCMHQNEHITEWSEIKWLKDSRIENDMFKAHILNTFFINDIWLLNLFICSSLLGILFSLNRFFKTILLKIILIKTFNLTYRPHWWFIPHNLINSLFYHFIMLMMSTIKKWSI